MDIFLIITGALCLLAGLVGCILPILPGVPLAYVGIWLLHATGKVQFSWKFLIIWGIVTAVVQILDAVVPVWGTKVMGGSKAGVWGSTIGLVAGLFFGPWGIVLGPFVGAVAGEMLAHWTEEGMSLGQALKAGSGAFVGLMTGTVLKLVCVGLMAYYFVAAIV
ncbi:MAG: DUF456 domain-containing protein [Bacteroidales bacterium]|nr:DUF456 domain-containing protein [Eggerthellaceae bacterium]MBR6162007.1 DUF456 domain-containing protein [Bacteroidales bacterium]MBR6903261.1 DUF456 domain-containing protein [Bacteroidales bacterium]